MYREYAERLQTRDLKMKERLRGAMHKGKKKVEAHEREREREESAVTSAQ
jgi:uncharacterized protein YaiI (UPF0178 family)